MREPLWINRDDCLAIHEKVLSQYGGLAGVRDEGLLESALAKPQNLFAYTSPPMTKLAASYASGIIRNHPFLDGNKRTGFLVAVVFLDVNDYAFTATEEAVVKNTLAMAAGKITEPAYAAWLDANSKLQR